MARGPERFEHIVITSTKMPVQSCEVPVGGRHTGFGSLATLSGRGSGTWATLAPVGRRHPIRASGESVPLRCGRSRPRRRRHAIVLVELGLVEQRYKAVLEVLEDAASVTDVARRYGVERQAVHTWLARYAEDGSGWPRGQELQARHLPAPDAAAGRGQGRSRCAGRIPQWGPRTILNRLTRAGSRTAALEVGDLSLPRAPRAHRSQAQEAHARVTTSAGSALGLWSCGRWT